MRLKGYWFNKTLPLLRAQESLTLVPGRKIFQARTRREDGPEYPVDNHAGAEARVLVHHRGRERTATHAQAGAAPVLAALPGRPQEGRVG